MMISQRLELECLVPEVGLGPLIMTDSISAGVGISVAEHGHGGCPATRVARRRGHARLDSESA